MVQIWQLWAGSQGGALSIVTKDARGTRVKWAAPTYPAMADMVGYLRRIVRVVGHIFLIKVIRTIIPKAKIKTAAYYDVVNFATSIQSSEYLFDGFQ
ncbi:MAG: hypothetical protein U5M51_12745 [Emticicia sp.]|nr:hypothetical protein [Emticicia sp.]